MNSQLPNQPRQDRKGFRARWNFKFEQGFLSYIQKVEHNLIFEHSFVYI